jgi:hypothetical protein
MGREIESGQGIGWEFFKKKKKMFVLAIFFKK